MFRHVLKTAAAMLVVAMVSWLGVACGQSVDDPRDSASTTTSDDADLGRATSGSEPGEEAPVGPPLTEPTDVEIEFRAGDKPNTFTGTVTNRGDQPWYWECMTGDLYRWDDLEWEQVGAWARWHADDAKLLVYQDDEVFDCGPVSQVLAPGASEQWPMHAEWIERDRGDMFGSRWLEEPGEYQLVVSDTTGRVAVGRFRIAGS